MRGAVEAVDGDLAAIRCSPPLFEEGDGVARVEDGRARGLGVVIEGGRARSSSSSTKKR